MRLQINVPVSLARDELERVLSRLGVAIVERKAKAPADFPPLAYRKRLYPESGQSAQEFQAANPDAVRDENGDWYVPGELDGVSVAKAIRKMDAAREAYNRHDGRTPGSFPRDGHGMGTAEYVAWIADHWHHQVPAAVAQVRAA